jgi:O-antigen ligase
MKTADDIKKRPPDKNNGSTGFIGLVTGSLLLGSLIRFADYLNAKLAESMIGTLFTSYDSASQRLSGFYEKIGSANIKIIGRIKRFFLNGFSGSVIINAFSNSHNAMLAMPMRSWGIGFLSAGLYTAAIWMLKHFVLFSDTRLIDLLIGAGATLISLLFFASGNTLSSEICSSRIAGFILFRFFGLRRDDVMTDEVDGSRMASAAALVAGTAIGILTYFISPVYIFAGIAALLAIRLVAHSPESGLIMILLALPFSPTMALVALNSWCVLCWIMKLLSGKRTLKVDPVDIWIMLFGIVYLVGGIVSAGGAASIKHSVVFCNFLLAYFMCVNLIRTGVWVKRCAVAIIFGSALVSLYGIYEYIFGLTETTWQDTEMFENISGRVVSTFGNPNVLAEYLLLTIPIAISLVFAAKKGREKISYFSVFGLAMVCLVLTWSRGAWLGLIIAGLIYLLLLNHRTLLLIFGGIFALPFLPYLMPQSVVSRFTSIGNLADTSTSYRVNIWKGALNIARDFIISGIGTGNQAFVTVYPKYSLAGIEGAPHSHNLYLQLLVEVGIFGLLLFIGAMISFARANFSFYRGDASAKTGLRYISIGGFAGVLAVLAQGMTDYVWYNYRIFLLFWMLAGLTVASRRAGIFENPIRAVKRLEDCTEDRAVLDIITT